MNRQVKRYVKTIPALFRLLHSIKFLVVQLISYPKWKQLSRREKVYLDLGSGFKKGANGWVTVDLHGADISYDLRKGLPLPSNSVDKIYTSHMFEHIPFSQLKLFIAECFRVLKTGGELSVCVPNARYYIDAYLNGTQFRQVEDMYQPAVVNTGSLIDQLNYIAYMNGEHCYMFDEENLLNTLKLLPFSRVSRRGFDPALDLKERDFESIYAIAIK